MAFLVGMKKDDEAAAIVARYDQRLPAGLQKGTGRTDPVTGMESFPIFRLKLQAMNLIP